MSKRFKVGMQVMVAGDHTGISPTNHPVEDLGFKNGETVELLKYDSKDETWEVKSLKPRGVRMWIKRKHLAPIEVKAEPAAEAPEPNPFKVGDKVELINPEANWASNDNVTTGVQYTVTQVTGSDQASRPYIKVSGGDARGVYWIECKEFKLSVPKPAEPERAWKIGDRFVVHGDTVYTIEVGHVKDNVKVTWVDQNGHNQSLLYRIATVDEHFSKGSWKLIEKTNIQENVSPVQTNDVPLQHTKTQTTMTKPTTLPVSPAFIVEAHRVACSDWKAKLEKMYPSVFQSTQTFKVGDKIRFPASAAFSDDTYILADVGKRHMVLINLQTGARWTELVKVGSESAITPEEMQKICGSQKLETILVNGTSPTLNTQPSTEKTLMAEISDIKAAYEAAADATTKRMIKDYFPEAFSKYVKFVSNSSDTVTLGPYIQTIDNVDFIIGRGLAPREELTGACIGVYSEQVEVEVVQKGDRTWVAFKKK
jgi:hypothetical protein